MTLAEGRGLTMAKPKHRIGQRGLWSLRPARNGSRSPVGDADRNPSSGTFPRSSPRAKPLVLAVDHSPVALARLRELLTRAGYEVLHADNGYAAIRMAREFQPDVVLLDVEMPGKSGIAVCEDLKKDPRTWRQLVLLLTAVDDPRYLRDGFRARCDGFLSKIVGDDELLRKLKVKLLPGTSVQGSSR